MYWARGKLADGRVVTGIVTGDRLDPRRALGSEESVADPVAVDDLAWLPPVQPGSFFGLWNNFHAAAEKNNWMVPEHPLYFLKPASCVVGSGAQVEIPDGIGRVLFEGELGIVIGKRARNLSVDEAADAIFGYTCINDFTALNILNADPSFAQWTRAKGYDGFGAMGPGIVTDVPWQELTVRTLVNGRERQSYPTKDMIFGPHEIVSRLSADLTLMPGDVIACGTSLGARPVKPGDQVDVVIDGIGSLNITMTAAG